MKNKTISKLAALGIASVTAISAMAIPASAELTEAGSGKVNGTTSKVYEYKYTAGGFVKTEYYATKDAADAAKLTGASLGHTGQSVSATGITLAAANGGSTPSKIYVNGSTLKVSFDSASGGTAYTVVGGSSGSSATPADASYGSEVPPAAKRASIHYATNKNLIYKGRIGGTTYYFPNLESLRSSGAEYITSVTPGNVSSYASASSMGTKVYFDMRTGEYINYPNEYTVSISGKSSNYDSNSTSTATIAIYRVNGKYYPTYSHAIQAAGGDSSKLEYVRGYNAVPHRYFSMTTGTFFSSYNSAIADTGSKKENVIDMGPYYDSIADYYGYYGSPLYDPYYDPYYGYYGYYGYPYGYYGSVGAYWYDRYGYGTTTTTNTKDTSTATSGSLKGWTNINNSISKAAGGSTITVNMNKEASIPTNTLNALKGKNVTVRFVLSNGAVFSLNGKDLSSTASFSPAVRYNTKLIPTKIIKSASKKNKAISTAQVTINGISSGTPVDVTVKLSKKRSGKTAKLYVYNSVKNSLSLVDSSKIQSDGKCTFNDVSQSGNFLVVIC